METAKSLDAQDISLTQQTTSLEDRRCSALNTGYLRNGIGKWRMKFPQCHERTTFRARNWLCVETPIKRILVFGTTIFTHHKLCHRSTRTVIGNIFDDRKTRAAVRAIDEWIKITSVVRIEQFTFTIRTNRYVCGNGLESALKAGRLFDFKCRIFIICQFIIYFYVVDLSQHRSFRCQTRNEAINIGRLPLNQNFHPTGRVAYPAMQIESDCQPVHKRTEPYSLHNTFN